MRRIPLPASLLQKGVTVTRLPPTHPRINTAIGIGRKVIDLHTEPSLWIILKFDLLSETWSLEETTHIPFSRPNDLRYITD